MMIITAATAPFCLLSPIFVEKWGRRPLFLTCSALCCIELLCVTAAQFTIDISGGTGTFLSAFFGVAGQLAGQSSLSLGVLMITPLLISELCIQSTRAVVGQIALIFPVLFAIVSVAVYSPAVEILGAALYIPFLLGAFVTFGLLFYHLPETRKLPVDEIVRRLSVCRSRANTLLRSRYGSMDAYNSHADLVRVRELVRARLIQRRSVG